MAIERDLDAPLIFHDSPTFILFSRLQYTDQMERARTMVSEFVAAAIERGDEHSREWAVMQLVLLEWLPAACDTRWDMPRRPVRWRNRPESRSCAAWSYTRRRSSRRISGC